MTEEGGKMLTLQIVHNYECFQMCSLRFPMGMVTWQCGGSLNISRKYQHCLQLFMNHHHSITRRGLPHLYSQGYVVAFVVINEWSWCRNFFIRICSKVGKIKSQKIEYFISDWLLVLCECELHEIRSAWSICRGKPSRIISLIPEVL